ncbi:MAG: hypothetical protein Q8K82_06735 [Gemmatimonadaceae bacterium]|nr:hypothetical protein [Gemmatimonadaceae bacterium]
MLDYTSKSYGRNEEVADIYRQFEADRNLSMPGPRRLGKTFLLDRLVASSEKAGWVAVKVEVAGCSETRTFFRELCKEIERKRPVLSRAFAKVKQRLGQLIDPRPEHTEHWFQSLISLDHETFFERVVAALDNDRAHRWVLLIDELPIFLKALHDKGPAGVEAARNFMNLFARILAKYSRVRWMITGSIGLEPLAQQGNYLGVLAKFHLFELKPLNEAQAMEYVKDLALTGRLLHRRVITDVEAKAIVQAVGWHAAYYLEALTLEITGEPTDSGAHVDKLIEEAMSRLLKPVNRSTFGVWEEHLNKHYQPVERQRAFNLLGALAAESDGLSLSVLLAGIGQPTLTIGDLRVLLARLHVDGFVTVADWDLADAQLRFRNLLLRRWWQRYSPQVTPSSQPPSP